MRTITLPITLDTNAVSFYKRLPALLLSQPSPVAKLVLAEVHDE